jgi:hypothetical protein
MNTELNEEPFCASFAVPNSSKFRVIRTIQTRTTHWRYDHLVIAASEISLNDSSLLLKPGYLQKMQLEPDVILVAFRFKFTPK